MAQHDYNIANQSGQAFRADLNNALAAIVSNNSGASAPSTTYAYQLWIDTSTTPATIKRRDASNSSWIVIGTADSSISALTAQIGQTNANSQYELARRDSLNSYPVPLIRPVQTNKVIALDVMPNGSPSEIAGNGFAWIDVCDADIKTGGSTPVKCARVGVRSDVVEFGSKNFDGAASPLPISFTMGALEAIRIGVDRKVGIKNNNPTADFDVRGSIAASDSYGNLNYLNIVGQIAFVGPSTNIPLSIFAGAAEAARFTTDGNLGIGIQGATQTSTGSRDVHIHTTTSTESWLRLTHNSSGSSSSDGVLLGLNGTSAYLINYEAGIFAFYNGGAEKARLTAGGYFKSSPNGTYLGSTAAYNEINSAADASNLIVNSTSTGSGVVCLASNLPVSATGRHIGGYTNGVIVFSVASNGNVTNTNNSYGAISDLSLKQDIVDAASQWDDLKQVKIRKFRFKDDPAGQLMLGVIAQELEQVSPGLVEESNEITDTQVPEIDVNGNPVFDEAGEPVFQTEKLKTGKILKTVKYSVLYMKAVKALQEAMERIEALEAKVAAMEVNG